MISVRRKRPREIALMVATIGVLLVKGGPSMACGTEPYLGVICPFAFRGCPVGYLAANGQLLQVSAYPALFKLLGTTYGGNGTQFALPNLTSRAPWGAANPSELGVPQGAPQVVLSQANIPSHGHAMPTIGGTATINLGGVPFNAVAPVATPPAFSNGATVFPTNGSLSTGLTGLYTTNAPTPGTTASLPVTVGGNALLQGQTSSVGQAQPIQVVSPSVQITYCVAVDGDYPNSN